MNKTDLEGRLIEFSFVVIRFTASLGKTKENMHLREQIIRSSTASALNYGEAQSAESRKDFIHKLGIVLKELRETKINLILLKRFNAGYSEPDFNDLIRENDELLAIFYKSIETAKSRS